MKPRSITKDGHTFPAVDTGLITKEQLAAFAHDMANTGFTADDLANGLSGLREMCAVNVFGLGEAELRFLATVEKEDD